MANMPTLYDAARWLSRYRREDLSDTIREACKRTSDRIIMGHVRAGKSEAFCRKIASRMADTIAKNGRNL